MRYLALYLSLVHLGFGVLTAYTQSTATLQGRVVDPTGAAVAGAQITVRNLATGVWRIVQTNRESGYQTRALTLDNYSVENEG
jgi:hypothetical protein